MPRAYPLTLTMHDFLSCTSLGAKNLAGHDLKAGSAITYHSSIGRHCIARGSV